MLPCVLFQRLMDLLQRCKAAHRLLAHSYILQSFFKEGLLKARLMYACTELDTQLKALKAIVMPATKGAAVIPATATAKSRQLVRHLAVLDNLGELLSALAPVIVREELAAEAAAAAAKIAMAEAEMSLLSSAHKAFRFHVSSKCDRITLSDGTLTTLG